MSTPLRNLPTSHVASQTPQSQHQPSSPVMKQITQSILSDSQADNIGAAENIHIGAADFIEVPKTFETSEIDPEKQAIERISTHLLFWVKSPHIGLDVQREREKAVNDLLIWLNSEERDSVPLELIWNALPPNIFQEKMIQDHLTHLTIHYPKDSPSFGSDIIELGVLKNCLKLEHLVITGEGIKQISDSIGDLQQLKYLEITSTDIPTLPESIGQMINLQSMSLENNKKMIQLPSSFVQLSNLTYLSLQGCEKITRLPDTNPRLPDIYTHSENHKPYRFSNLRALITLNLGECYELRELPQSICHVYSLKFLELFQCHALEKLPEHMHDLTELRRLSLDHTKVACLPTGLYQLALKNEHLSLPPPYNEAVEWMRNARSGNTFPYLLKPGPVLRPGSLYLQIRIRPDTMVPFAKEHLQLLIHQLIIQNRLVTPPGRVSVTYEGEPAVDAGGLRRDFFFHLLPNCAKQIENDNNPILVNKGDFLLLETSIGLEERIKKGELQSRMDGEERNFCKHIGRLIGAFLFGLGAEKRCKLGNVFPEHFYKGLHHLIINDVYANYSAFDQMSLGRQQYLCRILAIYDKKGLADMHGHLLFDMKCLSFKKNPNSNTSVFEDHTIPFDDEDLYKIWKLINHYEGNEENPAMAQKLIESGLPPSIARFMLEESAIMTKEDFAISSDAFPQGMLEAFRQELSTQESRLLIQSTLSRYMFDAYRRQCEPLVQVAIGFQDLRRCFPGNEDFASAVDQHLSNAAKTMQLDSQIHPGLLLSHAVQGPPFTYEGFALLMRDRCSVAKVQPSELQDPHAQPAVPPQQEQPGVREKMEVIQEWYLNEATDKQRKKLLRCMNATDVIQTDMRLTFGGPAQEERREGQTVRLVPRQFSIFHTCFASVQLGDELMQQDVTTPDGKAALIKTWKKHIKLAMPKEGSAGGFGVL